MNNWYERAIEQLEDDLDNDLISQDGFRQEIKYIDEELKETAEYEAQLAYDNVMSNYY